VRILIAEDEPHIADAVARGLRRQGMAVDIAEDGAAALYKARVFDYDVVILDRDLPKMHGDDVCRAINRERPEVKVLMLTASTGVDELVEGLALGADDYLGKPFRFAELVARIDALGRRTERARPAAMQWNDLEVDTARHTATRADSELNLTPKEFGVLRELVAAAGDVVSPEDLLERVWDENTDPFTNTVRMTVMTLRRKLGDPPMLATVQGAGYRMTSEPGSESG